MVLVCNLSGQTSSGAVGTELDLVIPYSFICFEKRPRDPSVPGVGPAAAALDLVFCFAGGAGGACESRNAFLELQGIEPAGSRVVSSRSASCSVVFCRLHQ